MEELNSDSVWNFHVWNEVWMDRPDLGKEYGGWQAIDATPQEQSEDMYRCGPASVAAVKHGEVLRPYDSSFLFAEVNADKVFWKYSGPTQPLKLLRKDVFGIGKLISTKAAGRFEREDITYAYKHDEKTREERDVMFKALRQSENLFARYYLNEDFNDIYFNFELKDDIKIGEPFDVSLVMRNKSGYKDYKVSVMLKVDVVTYRGKVGETVKKDKFEVSVKAGCDHEVKLHVTYHEYYKKLIHQCAFNISCLATVSDTKYEYFAQDDFRVRKPDIKIILRDKAKQGEKVEADIHLENPLPVPLRKGEFTVEGPGFKNDRIKIKMKNAIPPGQKASGKFEFTPPEAGRQNIAAKFVSKELDDVDGFLNFMVEPSAVNGEDGNLI